MSVGTGLATRVAEKPVAEGLARGVALSYEKTEVRVPASRAERRWTCHVSPLGRLGMTDEKAVCRRWGPHHFWLGACCPQDPLRKAETYIPPPPLNSIRAGGPGGSMPPTKRSRLEGLVSGPVWPGFKRDNEAAPRSQHSVMAYLLLLALPRPSLEAKPPTPRCRLSATARPQRESWGRIYTPSVPLPGTPPYQIGGWEGYDSQRIANPSLPWPGACLIEESISALGTRGEATPPVLY